MALVGLLLVALTACEGAPPAIIRETRPAPTTTPAPIGEDLFPELPDFATTGNALTPSDLLIYADRPPFDVTTAAVDSTGLAIWLHPTTQKQYDHPVQYAQYAIGAMLRYQLTGEQMWLDRAATNANRLEQIATDRDGAMWFPYTFDWTYYERTLHAPWWSGMAQGMALSVFSRLAQLQPDQPRWRVDADRVLESFTQTRVDGQPWASLVIDDHLYFEEYAGDQPPLQVLNGHIFAMFGLYDYWYLTGDTRASILFDAGASTVLTMMPLIRQEDGPSYYCVQANYCRTPAWQNEGYHPIHIWQLRTLGTLTGNPEFAEWADTLAGDFTP